MSGPSLNIQSNNSLKPSKGMAAASLKAAVSCSNPSFDQIEKQYQDFPEEFLQSSLVNKLKNKELIRNSGLDDPETHLFAHLHLGSRALETGFEGVASEETVNWAKCVL